MGPILVRLFPMPPALRDRCERAMATDPGLQISDMKAAQVVLFDAANDSIEQQMRAARGDCSTARFLLLSLGSEGRDCASALILGADGLVRYGEIETNLAKAVQHVASGYLWLSIKAKPSLVALESVSAAARGKVSLTRQEWKVTLLASIGFVNKQISSVLSITEATVKWHRANAYRKLGIHRRSAIAGAL